MPVSMKNQSGFSLIEVMVAAAISVIALLGLGLAQVKALQFATSSFQYTVATIEANNVSERLWPQLCDIVVNGQYAVLAPQIQAQAPGFTLTLPNNFSTDFNIDVTWQDERLEQNIAASVSLYPQYPTLDASNC